MILSQLKLDDSDSIGHLNSFDYDLDLAVDVSAINKEHRNVNVILQYIKTMHRYLIRPISTF